MEWFKWWKRAKRWVGLTSEDFDDDDDDDELNSWKKFYFLRELLKGNT